MLFLISLILAISICLIGSRFIKRYTLLSYTIAMLLSLLVIVIEKRNFLGQVPSVVADYILSFFMKGTLPGALLVLVMFLGVMSKGCYLSKKGMAIRGELSIIACILLLPHSFVFGKGYFRTFGFGAAGVVSMVLLVIMLPLWITSYRMIRKRMQVKTWKRIQKMAYVFYTLFYLHIMLLMVPKAVEGNFKYFINILVYTVIFLLYAVLRIMKARRV